MLTKITLSSMYRTRLCVVLSTVCVSIFRLHQPIQYPGCVLLAKHHLLSYFLTAEVSVVPFLCHVTSRLRAFLLIVYFPPGKINPYAVTYNCQFSFTNKIFFWPVKHSDINRIIIMEFSQPIMDALQKMTYCLKIRYI